MIDYDKLQLAHELTNQLPFGSYSFDCWCCNDFESGYFYVLTFEDDNGMSDSYESESIDDLITKLRELTQPDPKYNGLDEDDECYFVSIDDFGRLSIAHDTIYKSSTSSKHLNWRMCTLVMFRKICVTPQKPH